MAGSSEEPSTLAAEEEKARPYSKSLQSWDFIHCGDLKTTGFQQQSGLKSFFVELHTVPQREQYAVSVPLSSFVLVAIAAQGLQEKTAGICGSFLQPGCIGILLIQMSVFRWAVVIPLLLPKSRKFSCSRGHGLCPVSKRSLFPRSCSGAMYPHVQNSRQWQHRLYSRTGRGNHLLKEHWICRKGKRLPQVCGNVPILKGPLQYSSYQL